MPRLSHPADSLHQPLDALLGTQAAVRILRVLGRAGDALSPPVIARRARINRAGAGRTLLALARGGVVTQVGTGRYLLYRLDAAHPLAPALRALFDREAERGAALFDGLRAAADAMEPRPVAVWMLGGDGSHAAPAELVLVGDADHLGAQSAGLRERLASLDAEWRIDAVVATFTPQDVVQAVTQRDRLGTELEENAEPVWGLTLRQVVRAAPRR